MEVQEVHDLICDMDACSILLPVHVDQCPRVLMVELLQLGDASVLKEIQIPGRVKLLLVATHPSGLIQSKLIPCKQNIF